jgi:SAM-dependent methyltransferase
VSEAPACVVCGGPTVHRFASVVPGFTVVQCAVCGCGQTRPPLPSTEIGAWYPQAYYGTRNVRFNSLFELLTRWFRHRRADAVRRWTRPGTILDVGCGRGLTLAALRGHGYQSIGVELSEVAAVHAREILGLDVRVGNFLDLDFEKSSLTAVIFWHSLEHFADSMAALDHAAEILKPGGLLVIAVPNLESLQARATGANWFHLDVPRHYTHFSERGLKKVIEQRGFRIVDVAHFSLEQNPYGWIQSLLNFVFEYNLLYSILKDPEARAHQLHDYPLQAIGSAILGALLLPVSFALMMIEAALRRGGTIEVYAIKEQL